jgi:hypothetical protein
MTSTFPIPKRAKHFSDGSTANSKILLLVRMLLIRKKIGSGTSNKQGRGENWRSLYQLTVKGPKSAGALEVDVHGYGELNIERIDANVVGALRQLRLSASREEDTAMPRVVVLAFRSGLGPDDWSALEGHVGQLFDEHSGLSAIAVLLWKPDATAPPADAPFQVWTEYLAVSAVPTFIVYHNTNPQNVRPVPSDVFWDKWSVHLPPQKSYREEGQVSLETPNREG